MTKRLSLALMVAIAAITIGYQQQSIAKSAAAASPDQQVVATVNGQTITKTVVDMYANQVTRGHGEQLNPQQRKQLLDRLVEMTLLAQHAKQQGLDNRADVKAQLAYLRNAVLASAAVSEIRDHAKVSEDDIKAQYQKQFAHSGKKEYHARHILVKTEAEAKALIEQLNKGADFAALAKKNSIGPSAKRGGDLGWFDPSSMVPAFAKATEQLKAGEYTKEPVKTQYGWHVIKLEGVKNVPPPSLKDVHDRIVSELQAKQIEATVEKMRKAANITYGAQ